MLMKYKCLCLKNPLKKAFSPANFKIFDYKHIKYIVNFRAKPILKQNDVIKSFAPYVGTLPDCINCCWIYF